MKIKSKLLFGIIALAAVVMLVMSACGDKDEDPDGDFVLNGTNLNGTIWLKDAVEEKKKTTIGFYSANTGPKDSDKNYFYWMDWNHGRSAWWPAILLINGSKITVGAEHNNVTFNVNISGNTLTVSIFESNYDDSLAWMPSVVDRVQGQYTKLTEGSTFFTFEENDDGSSLTLAIYYGHERVVTIPAEVNGKAVTEIGQSAFSGATLTSVIIPNSVTEIGDYAFVGNQLTSITIGANVTLGDTYEDIYYPSFDDEFDEVYNDNKLAGTYKRTSVDSTDWAKQP